MKYYRRVISIIIALAILVGVAPLSAVSVSAESAYSGQCGDNAFWEYDTENCVLTISGEGDMYDYSYNSGVEQPWIAYINEIKEITIASGITRIGDRNFADCDLIKSILIPETVVSIGAYAFDGCENLLQLDIPESVEVIEYGAFWFCSKLSNVTLREGLRELSDAFNGTAILSIYIPSTVVDLSDYNEGSNSIGFRYQNPFDNCSKLSNIEVGENNEVYTVINGALYNKKANVLLTSPKTVSGTFAIQDGTEWIAAGAFEECLKLIGVTIPSSVKIIGQWAFMNCESLKSIFVPANVETIDTEAFYECYSLEEILVDENNAYYSDIEGLLYSKDGTILYICPSGKKGSLTLPDCLNTISREAFSFCGYLSEINVSKNVECIDYIPGNSWNNNHCFDMCMRFVESAWDYISELKAINVSQDNKYFSSVNGVLYNKEKTKLISYPSGKTGNYTVLSGTEVIGGSAFSSAYLSNLIIPDSVTKIEESAILGVKNLHTVTILNPACSLEDGWVVKTDVDNNDISIFAPLGSTAEEYALKYNYPFYATTGSSGRYMEKTLGLYYSFDKNNIELGDIVNVGADYLRGNSFGMMYDGEMRWELSNPEVLKAVSYSSSAALLYFEAVGLGSCDITLYLDGDAVVTDTVTVKVSDETLLEDNSEYVFNSSAFTTLETARSTCKKIIDEYSGAEKALSSFFYALENGVGVGVITKEALAAVGLTTGMAEEAEDEALENMMMELISTENPVGDATKKVEKGWKMIKNSYSAATVDLKDFFKTVSEATGYTVEQVEQLHNTFDDFSTKTDITFSALDVTISAIIISQFELETIRDIMDATAYGSMLYLSLERLYDKRSNLVAYAIDRFLNEQAIDMLNEFIGKLGGPTYKIAAIAGYWANLMYELSGGLDATDYLVAQNAYAYARYLYSNSLKQQATADNFERYFKYYIAAVKSALKAAVDISNNYKLTNIADGLYEQIELTCNYEGFFDQVRDDLMNVSSVSKESLANGKVFACYGGGIASYSLLSTASEEDTETSDNFYSSIDSEKILSVPAYIEGSEISGIADYGFAGVTEMQGFMLPLTIESIGEYSFVNCNNAKIIYLNSGLLEIGQGAFEGCESLEFLSFPKTLQTIGSNAFSGCVNLERVTFENGVTNIGSKAFENCTGLTAVYFHDTDTVIAVDAFAGCTALTVYGYSQSTAQAFAENCGFDFIAFEEAVTEMKISTHALQQTLVEGESVSTEGLTVEVSYMDGSSETINGGWSVICDTLTAGEQQVYIYFKDGCVSYPVTVTERKIEELTLSEEELTLFITDSYRLVAECDRDISLEDLVWSCDNTDVLTVSEGGYVTAVSVGTATVMVCSKDGSVSDSCKIDVVNTEAFATQGETVKSSLFSPSKSGYYTFYSLGSDSNITAMLYNSNGDIISADCGKNIRISVWLVDDEAYFMDISTCDESNEFTVGVSEYVKAESVIINSKEYSGKIGSVYELDTAFLPENAFNEALAWATSDSSIVSVDASGNITLLKKGTATVTVTSENGLSDSCLVTVEGYPEIKVNEQTTVTVDSEKPLGYLEFVPENDGYYSFYSISGSDTYGHLYDEEMNQLLSDDDSGDELNFKIKYHLEAGVTYILGARYLSTSLSGSFDVCVEEIEYITKLELVSMPTRTEYIEGFASNVLNHSGLKLKATWSDGTTTDWCYDTDSWNIGEESLSIDSSTVNDDGIVRITCGGKEVSYTLTLVENPVAYLEVINGTSKKYVENYNGYTSSRYNEETGENEEYFCYYTDTPYDAVVQIVYKDGTSRNSNIGSYVDGYYVSWSANQSENPWVIGENNVSTVSYLGVSVDLPITVIENTVTSIEVVSGKMEIIEEADGYTNSRYDQTSGQWVEYFHYSYSVSPDIIIKIKYIDGTSKNVALDEEIDGFKFELSDNQYSVPWVRDGENYLTASYLGKTAEIEVIINENPVESIAITKAPNKIEYYNGYYPDFCGMELTITYADGTNKLVAVTEDVLTYEYSIDFGVCFNIEYEDEQIEIYKNYNGDYVVSYMGRDCLIDCLVWNENTEISYVELDNVSSNGEDMTVNIAYSDETTENIVVQCVCGFEFDETYFIGYTKTKNGLLSYSIETYYDLNGKIDFYYVYVLGQEIKVELQSGKLNGDANGDGIITADDLVFVRRALLHGTNADVNGDEVTNVKDLIAMKKILIAQPELGDIDNDGAITANDLAEMRRIVLNGEVVGNADINQDGVVNVKDIIRLKRYLAGEDVDF